MSERSERTPDGPHGSRWRLAAMAALLVLAGVLASCGVARSGHVKRIDRSELGGLDDTLPTTPTSTTVVPVPVPTSEQPTTTQVPTVTVQLYFLLGDQLTPVPYALPTSYTKGQAIAALQNGPPSGNPGAGLRTAVPRQAGLPTVVDDGTGVATVDLPPSFFNVIVPTADQRLAIAQIARTMLEQPGIGQVRFTLGGVPTGVPRGNGEIAQPGESLTKLDFDNLLVNAPPSTTSTTTTTTSTSSTTTVPVSEVPRAETTSPPGGLGP